MQVPMLGCSAFIENSESKRGHNYVKIFLRITYPTGDGFSKNSNFALDLRPTMF